MTNLRALPIAALLVVLAAPAGALADGSRAAAPGDVSAVVAPRQGALVGAGRPLVVRARIGARVREAELRLGGRVVARRSEPGPWVVTFDGADRPRAGSRRLVLRVTTRSGGVTVHVVRVLATRPDPRLMRASIRRTPSARSPVGATARVHASATVFRARLNGRDVSARFIARGDLRHAHLSAATGLRFGANTLTLTAIDPAGRHHAVTRSLTVPAVGPLAGARAPRSARRGATVTLDARSSLPAGAGSARRQDADPLAYAWSVVDAPAGSSAQPADPAAETSVFTPDVRGDYTLGLAVSGTGGTSYDTVRMKVRETGALVPLATFATCPSTDPSVPSGPGIAVGDQCHTRPTVADAPAAVHAVALDRSTLELRDEEGFSASSDPRTGVPGLRAFIAGRGPGDLVVVTSGPQAPALSAGSLARLNAAIESIGGGVGPVFGRQVDLVEAGEAFSVVGIPGMAPGQGWTNAGTAMGPAAAPGAIDGYLTPGIEISSTDPNRYSFTFGDVITVDTRAAGDASGTANTVSVSDAPDAPGTLLASEPPGPGDVGGFQVVTIDSLTGAAATATFWTNGAGGAAAQKALVASLRSAVNGADLVALVSLGRALRPTALDPDVFADLLMMIDALNGNRHLFASTAAGETYSMIGGSRSPGGASWPPESSSLMGRAATDARVSAHLERGRGQGRFWPTPATVGGAPRPGLLPIAFQAPTPWPSTDTPGGRLALGYLATTLGMRNPDPRANYRDRDTAVDELRVDLQLGVSYPGDGHGFTQADFDAAKAALVAEFEQVTEVRDLIDNLQKPYIRNQLTSESAVTRVVDDVMDDLASRPASGDDGYTGGLRAFGAAVGVVAAIDPDPDSKRTLQLVSAGSHLAANLLQSGDGSGGDRMVSVGREADAVSARIAADMSTNLTGLDRLEAMIVGDPAKLARVSTLATTDPGWVWDDDAEASAESALLAANRQTAYTALVPTVYTTWIYARTTRNPDVTDARRYSCRSGGGGRFVGSRANQFHAIDGLRSGALAVNARILLDTGSKREAYDPSAPLLKHMFASADEGGAALFAPFFWMRAPGQQTLACGKRLPT